LKAADLDSVVLIGPTAAQVDSIGINGERSVGLPSGARSPLAAMKHISGNSDIGFAVDDDMTGTPIPTSALSHDGQPGLERTGSGASQTDPQLNFTVKKRQRLCLRILLSPGSTLTVPDAGSLLALSAGPGTTLASLSTASDSRNRRFPRRRAWRHPAKPTGQRDPHKQTALTMYVRAVDLTAGRMPIEITTTSTVRCTRSSPLSWYTPRAAQDGPRSRHRRSETRQNRGVSCDAPRAGLGCPAIKTSLCEEVAAVNPNTVVVLNDEPARRPAVDRQSEAVLEMWWPGDEGGCPRQICFWQDQSRRPSPCHRGRASSGFPATNPKYPSAHTRAVDGKTTYSEGVNVWLSLV